MKKGKILEAQEKAKEIKDDLTNFYALKEIAIAYTQNKNMALAKETFALTILTANKAHPDIITSLLKEIATAQTIIGDIAGARETVNQINHSFSKVEAIIAIAKNILT